jgi:phospholipid/cholesterol/gamma-HCH transport system substrate-binding protein
MPPEFNDAMAATSSINIERRVGIFVFFGILVTCALIIQFGKVGDRFRGGFPITVKFSSAGGLVSGAQVLYGGVKVGKVDSVKLNEEGDGVLVDIDMFEKEGHKVRNDARFLIRTSGFLGDQHVMISPVSTTAPRVKAGDVIRGVDPFDFSEAVGQAGEALRKLNVAIGKIYSLVEEPDTLENLRKSFKNFSELAKKLEGNSDRFNQILGGIEKGQGTLGKLVKDDSLFEELNKLIYNWRVYGILHQEKSDLRYPSPRKKQTE